MEESIFAKIIRGDIPSHKIYEDSRTFAFLDIRPIVNGHVLVVPKVQVDHIWDLETVDYCALWETAQKIAQHMRQTLKVQRVGIKVVGEEVPHAHIHLIPFNTAEEYNRTVKDALHPSDDELAEMAKRLSF
jgi:histidine triad (HIT) family protein